MIKSPDITPYTNERSIEKIVVPLGQDLNDYKDRYVNIMDPHVRILARNHVMQGNAANISRGRVSSYSVIICINQFFTIRLIKYLQQLF